MSRPNRVSLSPPGREPVKKGWPKSAESLPYFSANLLQQLKKADVEFPINEECTSLAIVPSGRHVVAGFTDGTLRLFDLTDNFGNARASPVNTTNDSGCESLFDNDSSSEEGDSPKTRHTGSTLVVCSRSHSRYGTVACQIHAKGVHTSLQMTVDISPDGLYAFGGVARGSMELVAVDLTLVERHHDRLQRLGKAKQQGMHVLDLIKVHRHVDAKLRGFGACTRLLSDVVKENTYILLTGKGIKNIHIWSFCPAQNLWQCLYDTQTNGNSISLLHLRYSEGHQLQALSKSDSQRVRVWDLTYEQHQGSKNSKYFSSESPNERPKRPPYTDVSSSESTLGIAGDYLFGGHHQQITLTNLTLEAPSTELAIPHQRRLGRPQRGELRSLTQVAGMATDASHVLLEMSDGSVIHYLHQTVPRLEMLMLPGNNGRTMCVARVGSQGHAVAIVASQGTLTIKMIGEPSVEGFWGFHGAGSEEQSSPTTTDSIAIADAASGGPPPVTLFKPSSSVLENMTPDLFTQPKQRIVPVTVSKMTPAAPASALKEFDGVISIPATSLSKKDADGAKVSPDSSGRDVKERTTSSKKRVNIEEYHSSKKKLILKLRHPREAKQATDQPPSSENDFQAAASVSRPGNFHEDRRRSKSPKKRKAAAIAANSTSNQAQASKTTPAGQTKDRRSAELDLVAFNIPSGITTVPPSFSWNLPSVPVSHRFRISNGNADRRVKLALEHRAAHEMLRRKVLETATSIIRALKLHDVTEEEAKATLEDAIDCYVEILDELMFRQEIESSALAAVAFLPLTPAVSFPFPEVFDQARKVVSDFIEASLTIKS